MDKKYFVYNASQYKYDCKERIKKVLMDKLMVNESDVQDDDANLVLDLSCDSLDIVEITMELEEEFNILIPDDKIFVDFQKLTISYIVEIVKECLDREI